MKIKTLPILTVNYIIDKYKSGMSSIKIAKELNCSAGTIVTILKKNNIDIRSHLECHNKYSVNENFFKQIDSQCKAQILGFIAADGCISKNSLIIAISDKDANYLEWINKKLEYTGQVKRYRNTGGFNINLKRYCSRLAISNQRIVKDLSRYGIVPQKSLKMTFPNEGCIPDEYIKYFILGYLEGDGCICVLPKYKIANVQICGTKEFLGRLQDILKEKIDINSNIGRTDIEKARNVNAYVLRITGNQQVLKFLNWIYDNNEFKMQRKYDKFLEVKQLYTNNITYRKLKRNNYEVFI